MRIHGSRDATALIVHIAPAPDPLEKDSAFLDAARIAREMFEQAELHRGQSKRFSIACSLFSCRVEDERSDLESLISARLANVRAASRAPSTGAR